MQFDLLCLVTMVIRAIIRQSDFRTRLSWVFSNALGSVTDGILNLLVGVNCNCNLVCDEVTPKQQL